MPMSAIPVDPDAAVPLSQHLVGHMRRWDLLLAISAGGAVGSLARWSLTFALPTAPDAPWATFTANAAGCLLLGALMVVVAERRRGHPWLRPFLGIGVLGGFTTFSTYALDTRMLLADGRGALALAYLAGSVLTGLLATVIGLAGCRVLTRRFDRGEVSR